MATWSRFGHEIGFGIRIAHGFATLGTIGFEGRFDYAAIGTRPSDWAFFWQLFPLVRREHLIDACDDLA